jgi:hypothetical protein
MSTRPKLALSLALGAALLTSCGSTTTIVRAVQLESLQHYSQVRTSLPDAPVGALRLYIYRPQAVLGMWGGAIVIVNGRWFGDPANYITDNMLIPGAVFVVDVPAGTARVTWAQPGRPEGTDKPLELSSTKSPVMYLRWMLKPTYGLLEEAPADQGASEIVSLRFSGHVTLGGQ